MNDYRHRQYLRAAPICLAIALLIGRCTGSAHAADWNIAALMQSLAERKQARATFVETSYLSILDRPVTSSGELAFSAPDHLEKITLQPKREAMVLDGGVLTIERKQKKHRLELADYPQIAAFTDSIRGALAGDLAALEHSYELTLSGDAQQWSLLLTPKTELGGVEKIIIVGAANTLSSIEIRQRDGDRSTMQIEDLAESRAAPDNAKK